METREDALMQEVQRYYSYITSEQPTLSILTNIARHFANWQKEQIMKDAVAGHCFVDPIYGEVMFVQTDKFENKQGFKHGDNCKVMVLKEL